MKLIAELSYYIKPGYRDLKKHPLETTHVSNGCLWLTKKLAKCYIIRNRRRGLPKQTTPSYLFKELIL
jgi:hypothetical protein